MTEQERRERIEALKQSMRETDKLRELNRVETERLLARLDRLIDRMLRAS